MIARVFLWDPALLWARANDKATGGCAVIYKKCLESWVSSKSGASLSASQRCA